LKAKQKKGVGAGSEAATMKKTKQAVFFLWHFHGAKNQEDAKLIGVYSSEHEARAAQNRIKLLPGFKEHRNSFLIDKCDVGRDHWKEQVLTQR
jgi:hypothetical protein